MSTIMRTCATSAILVVALLGMPTAAAADPSVAPPSAGSLATGTARFAVTQEATGRVTAIFVSSTNELNSIGTLEDANAADDGESIYSVPEESSVVKMSRPIYAGVHYFMWSWRPVNPDGTTGDLMRSNVQSFTMRPIIRNVLAGAIYQDASRPAAGVSGSFVSNVRTRLNVTCRVTKGRTAITTKRLPSLVTSPMGRTKWSCLQMSIPESYDGSKLKLTVTVSGGGRSAKRVKFFTAR